MTEKMKCNMCEQGNMELKVIDDKTLEEVPEGKPFSCDESRTFMWFCDTCANVQFEYYSQHQADVIARYLCKKE